MQRGACGRRRRGSVQRHRHAEGQGHRLRQRGRLRPRGDREGARSHDEPAHYIGHRSDADQHRKPHEQGPGGRQHLILDAVADRTLPRARHGPAALYGAFVA